MQVGVSTWYPADVTSGLDADVAAFLARLTTPPTTDRASLYNTLILSLKSAGVWSKLDALYIFAAADSQAAGLNLVNSNFTCTPFSSPTFTPDRGYAGDGSTSYVDTNYDTGDSANIKLQRNSATLGVYANTSTAAADVRECGSRNFAATTFGSTSGMSFRSAATNTDTTVTTFANSVAMSATSRSNVSNHDTYRNGVFVETLTRTSVVLSLSHLLVGCFNNNGVPSQFSSRRVACVFAGSSMTSGELLAAYNAIHTYLVAVGGD
ncbi:hypothetical protein [Rhizobium leguminosarum]|uniref:hypothetical protein n=1 Tax=Rhizobium leguminosarum TaxID=384 RepID=UPI0012F86D2B|nr:hypothetical protein [Rhizobium leguminosarum]MVO95073.1 hypothetical protein [Rhizobium leguminosarum bv. phaseoli]